MSTIQLSADQNTATIIPPVKAVRVEFVEAPMGYCCSNCCWGEMRESGVCVKRQDFPCAPGARLDGRNGYWAKAKGKRVRK